MENIIAAIVGGFLAAGAGWFIQSRIENARINRVRSLFIIGLRDDLSNSRELYDRLRNDWDKSGTVWFTTINEFTDSREIYVRNKDWITVISDEGLRQKILQYYRQSANHLTQLQNAQQRKYDIMRHYNALVRDLRTQQGLTQDQAQREAFDLLDQEADELTNVNQQLPNLIYRLDRFKSDADNILRELDEQ